MASLSSIVSPASAKELLRCCGTSSGGLMEMIIRSLWQTPSPLRFSDPDCLLGRLRHTRGTPTDSTFHFQRRSTLFTNLPVPQRLLESISASAKLQDRLRTHLGSSTIRTMGMDKIESSSQCVISVGVSTDTQGVVLPLSVTLGYETITDSTNDYSYLGHMIADLLGMQAEILYFSSRDYLTMPKSVKQALSAWRAWGLDLRRPSFKSLNDLEGLLRSCTTTTGLAKKGRIRLRKHSGTTYPCSKSDTLPRGRVRIGRKHTRTQGL